MESKAFLLFDRFPTLAVLPRVALGAFPSPVELVQVVGVGDLWLKRDDRNAPVAAGNKVRALEFLLGSLAPGEVVITAGGQGSTHVYATAVHARRLGGHTLAARWPHEMSPESRAVAEAARLECATTVDCRWVGGALLRVMAWRLGIGVRRASGADPQAPSHYLPIGGSNALGVLGHVNAGLELAQQVDAGLLPDPSHVVVPLGSGGTAAGLALGLGIGGSRATVVAARVGPRAVANLARVRALIDRTRRLMLRVGGIRTSLPAARVLVDHSVYGGAYGRPLAEGDRAASLLRGTGSAAAAPILDATYAAKAGATAIRLAVAGTSEGGSGGRAGGKQGGQSRCVVLWVTFDGRVALEPSGGDSA